MRWLTATQPHGANLVVASSASSHPAALRTARESYRWLLAEGLLDATWLYQALHVLVQARLELLNMHGLVDWQPAGRRLDADLGGILRLLVGRAPRGGGGWGGVGGGGACSYAAARVARARGRPPPPPTARAGAAAVSAAAAA